jgi:hypothetical protein
MDNQKMLYKTSWTKKEQLSNLKNLESTVRFLFVFLLRKENFKKKILESF